MLHPRVEYLAVYLGLAMLGPLFSWLERRGVGADRGPFFTAARRLDLVWWLVTPLFTGTVARILLLGIVAIVARVAGFGADGNGFLARIQGMLPFARLPWPVAFVLALVVADFFAYSSHRLRHTAALWRVHAVHHAAEDLTALTAARLHPLDEIVDTILIGVPVLLLGFPLSVFAALGPFFVLHTLMIHARVSWTFGPLGRVFASPRFHRRHHARGLPAANFGGVLSLYDVIFGTFEMPAVDPVEMGIDERDVPESLFAQLAYPFRRLAAMARGS